MEQEVGARQEAREKLGLSPTYAHLLGEAQWDYQRELYMACGFTVSSPNFMRVMCRILRDEALYMATFHSRRNWPQEYREIQYEIDLAAEASEGAEVDLTMMKRLISWKRKRRKLSGSLTEATEKR